MGYIHEDELIQFPNQDNGTPAMPSSYKEVSLGMLRLLRSEQDLKNYIVDFTGFKAS